MGVIFAGVREGDAVVAIARNTEDDAVDEAKPEAPEDQPADDGRTTVRTRQPRADSQEDST